MDQFVSYLRVSTQRQGQSGLGLEAQEQAVARHIATVGGILVRQYVEVESGKKDHRPELEAAMADAKRTGATLVVAKLDRLARDAHFLLGIMKAGVEFVACDNPQANRLTIGILAVVAEEEARAISERTRAALAARKARGLPCGWAIPTRTADQKIATENASRARAAEADAFAAKVGPQAAALREDGLSLARIAEHFNASGIPTARSGNWYDTTVRNLLSRWETTRKDANIGNRSVAARGKTLR